MAVSHDSSDRLRRAASRGLSLLIVNHTAEQLELQGDNTQLWRGKWGKGSPVSGVIEPGGCATWSCSSAGVAHGLAGYVTYRFVGDPPHDRIRFSWKSRYFGPNAYSAETSREGLRLMVKGGGGAHAFVALFIGG